MLQGRWWKSQIALLTAFFLGLGMMLGTGAMTSAPAQTVFTDIENYWARDCINDLTRRNILEQSPDGLFRPDSPTTWGEYAVLVSRTFPERLTIPELPILSIELLSEPIELEQWAEKLAEQKLGLTLQAAAQANFLSAYPYPELQPKQPITRTQTIVSLAIGLDFPYVATAHSTLKATFNDAAMIPDYAKEAVAAALNQGMVVNYPNPRLFEPSQVVTRGEMAALFCRASNDPSLRAKAPTDAIAIPQFPDSIPPPSTELRGVWLTNIDSNVLFSRESLGSAVDTLAGLNFNTLYPTVWNWGYTLYPSKTAEREIGAKQGLYPDLEETGRNEALEAAHADYDMLKELIDLAHPKGMSVIPWFEFGFMAPADSELARRHPDWLTQKQDGSFTVPEGDHLRVWMNPFHPEVQRFMLFLINDLMANYDVDGFQVDDHLGLPVEYGYDPVTVELYQQEHDGQSPPDDPRDPEWMQWRADKITEFMGEVFQVVKARKPNAIMSVSPNPHPFAYKHFLQNWPDWRQRGYVEEIIIQLYRSDISRFIWEMNKPTARGARGHVPTSIGILTGLRNLPVPITQIQEQINSVRDRDYAGVSFFFYESLWNFNAETPEERAAGLQAAFPNSARRP
ncbi:MAG: family 10 glycosylhydrolase [Leptolyngbyaceae cyanobacterium MO_188.B28]|nr:family 10 glycosylhydrolase [Leptolyngbyaceae cyanobacterium MO_188.B28]